MLGIMLKLRSEEISQKVLDALRNWQIEVDSELNYRAQVARAKVEFSRKNTSRNSVFSIVRSCVRSMAPGASRCAYCEDSLGDEVEHIYPKDFYPNRVFDFQNYLAACGPCNSPKGNNFAIFRTDNQEIFKLSKEGGELSDLPPSGDAVLINPRVENASNYLQLDLWGTFRFEPLDNLGIAGRQKAEYTIDVLRLNKRDYLIRARRAACDNARRPGSRAGAGFPAHRHARPAIPHPRARAQIPVERGRGYHLAPPLIFRFNPPPCQPTG